MNIAPDCEGCGGPMTALEGQTISMGWTYTLLPDGTQTEPFDVTGWCGPCIAQWNERIAA